MEVLYGVIMLVTFLIGLGIGLTIPFFIKKYVKQYQEKTIEIKEVKEVKEEQTNKEVDKLGYYPKDLLQEWMTGEEVKANEE